MPCRRQWAGPMLPVNRTYVQPPADLVFRGQFDGHVLHFECSAAPHLSAAAAPVLGGDGSLLAGPVAGQTDGGAPHNTRPRHVNFADPIETTRTRPPQNRVSSAPAIRRHGNTPTRAAGGTQPVGSSPAVRRPEQPTAPEPVIPEAAQVRPSLWERSPLTRLCLVSAGLLAVTVVAGVLGGALAAIPAVALGLYLLSEWNLATRRAETEAVVRRAAQEPQTAATADAPADGAATQTDPSQPPAAEAGARSPSQRDARREVDPPGAATRRNSARSATGVAAAGAPSRSGATGVPRVARSPERARREHDQQLRDGLLQWAGASPTKGAALEHLFGSIRTRSPVLDLCGLGLSNLPAALKKFTWVREVKVSRAFLRRNGNTSGGSPVSAQSSQPLDRAAVRAALQNWQRGQAGATDEQVTFFLECFDNRYPHIDLRRAGFRSIPDVVADFPRLQTISSSVNFLFRRGR